MVAVAASVMVPPDKTTGLIWPAPNVMLPALTVPTPTLAAAMPRVKEAVPKLTASPKPMVVRVVAEAPVMSVLQNALVPHVPAVLPNPPVFPSVSQ